MTERLDRIESAIEALNQQIAANAQQVVANAEAITLMVTEMIPAIRLDAERTRQLATRADTEAAENRVRFNNLLEEARADRARGDQRFAESNQRFAAQLSEIRALGEQNRALLSALASTNGRVDALEQAG